MTPVAGFLLLLAILLFRGLFVLQPNQSAVLLLFGSYQGTVRQIGPRWTNPFCRRVKISLRARKIVRGAVSMVEMALAQLQERGIIEFDPERKATMVSNLLVVLCGESDTQPVINTGTLYH